MVCKQISTCCKCLLSKCARFAHIAMVNYASLQSSLVALQHALHKHLCDVHALAVMYSAIHALAGIA